MVTKAGKTHAHKANFTDIYDQPDPRGYFRTLAPLDYQIPQQALPVLESALAASARPDGTTRDVLDVCCSYGINGGLLRHRIDIEQMSAHYRCPESAAMSTDELRAADTDFYAQRLRRPELTVYGLDAAPNAISYATDVGLVADGWAENLEGTDASAELASGIKSVGLISCTGGVGYIGAPTFRRLLNLVGEPDDLWLVVFVLRAFSYDEVAAMLTEAGLVTERLAGVTFPQRRFDSLDEQAAAIEDVAARGIDPAGKGADGWFHADCFVTRPAAAVARMPVGELIAG